MSGVSSPADSMDGHRRDSDADDGEANRRRSNSPDAKDKGKSKDAKYGE